MSTQNIPAAQHVKGACGLAPETEKFVKSNPDLNHEHAVFGKDKLWPNGSDISYSFFGGTANQQAAVQSVVVEWTYYANINLTQADDHDADAMIRIGFNANGGSWSAVGTGAEKIKKGELTMNLGWIADSPTVSADDRGTILHEWGHALGLMHEHQSPARGGTLTLKTDKVYTYYRATQGWSNDLIKSQIIDVYNLNNVSNFSKLDTTSIMMYFMPASMNAENIEVRVNNKLSDMDKAYILINYPRKRPHPKAKDWTLERALGVAGVPAGEIKAYLGWSDESIRTEFEAWNILQRQKELDEEAKRLRLKPTSKHEPSRGPVTTGGADQISQLFAQLLNDTTQHALQPKILGGKEFNYESADVGVEHSIWSGITGIFNHPLFKPIVSGVIDTVLTQRGLNPAPVQQGLSTQVMPYGAPYDAQQGLFSTLGSIIKNPTVQKLVTGVVNSAFAQHGIQHSPDVEHGLLSDIGSIIGHPMVRQTLRGIVDGALSQRGLNPAGTAQYPEIQQGVWSSLVNILKNPALHKIVASVVDATLVQKGLKPAPQHALAPVSTASPFEEQHGIISSISSILSNPTVRRVLGGVVDAVLVQRGYNPKATATQYPEVQQGIWSGLIDVLKNPAFQNVLGTVVKSTLVEHGLNAQSVTADTSAGAPPAEVQQFILPAIFSVVTNPIFQSVVGGVVGAVFKQHGLNPVAPPANVSVQQGLFNSDTGPFLEHPAAGVVKTILAQHGLNAQATGGDDPEIQQSIWSGVLGVLKSPVFQKVAGTVVDAALSFGLDPSKKASAPVEAQQGLLSGLGSLINHPLVRQTLTEVVNSVLTQRGLDARSKEALANPDVQQGIWSGLTGILGNPTFQQVVGKLVNGALTQHSILPVHVHPTLAVQQDLSAEPEIQNALSRLAVVTTGNRANGAPKVNGKVHLNGTAYHGAGQDSGSEDY
ncbi:hypothetical protein H0H81_003639 [Sphagnurus paluster]|uniref:Peptidase metallopeptidase domain-containing protein n=1 Tax=Sphagnurus paluster TaxID=117069 RepID=A0A9P7FV18_9AGAR|nr:hypothetical protein H0H81_003639 [Sphagnurus paluster]